MKTKPKMVSTHEAKTHLSRLLDRVLEGEEIVIGRSNQPIARLVPYEAPPKKRQLGRDRGNLWMAADFDAPLPESWIEDFEK
jgi:prevent-host-death family protein